MLCNAVSNTKKVSTQSDRVDIVMPIDFLSPSSRKVVLHKLHFLCLADLALVRAEREDKAKENTITKI